MKQKREPRELVAFITARKEHHAGKNPLTPAFVPWRFTAVFSCRLISHVGLVPSGLHIIWKKPCHDRALLPTFVFRSLRANMNRGGPAKFWPARSRVEGSHG
jgi:hypothetical protein